MRRRYRYDAPSRTIRKLGEEAHLYRLIVAFESTINLNRPRGEIPGDSYPENKLKSARTFRIDRAKFFRIALVPQRYAKKQKSRRLNRREINRRMYLGSHLLPYLPPRSMR
jgi:hypothetical protein